MSPVSCCRLAASSMLLMLVCVFVAPAHGQNQEQQQVLLQIQANEEAGRLDSALARIPPATTLPGLDTAHVSMLRRTVKTLKIVDIYQEKELPKKAKELLESLILKLDKQRDVYLVVAVEQRLDRVQAEVGGLIWKENEALVDKGEALLSAKKYTEAITTFEVIIDADEGNRADSTYSRARRGMIQAQTAKELAADSFFQRIKDTVFEAAETIGGWIIYFVLAILLVLIFRQIRRLWNLRVLGGIAMALEDHTVAAEDREDKSRTLMREVLHEIRTLGSAKARDIAIESMVDLDQADTISVESAPGGLATLETNITETPITVGPVSLNPRQLFSYMASFFRRSYEFTLTGILSTSGDDTILWVEKQRSDGTVVEGARFEASATGDTAQAEVVRDIAIQIALSLAQTAETKNWQSLRAYLHAEALLTDEETVEDYHTVLVKALDMLRTSLHHDPANKMARLRLATVLHKLGKNQDAAEQFSYIDERLIRTHETPLNDEFRWIVQYKHVVSLSKLGMQMHDKKKALQTIEKALGIVERLIEEVQAKTEEPDTNGIGRFWRQLSFPKAETKDRPDDPEKALTSPPDDPEKALTPSPDASEKDLTPSERRILMLARSARAAARSAQLEALLDRIPSLFKALDKASEADKKNLKK